MAKEFWKIQKSLVHIAYHKYIFLSDFFGYVPENPILGTISDPSLVNILWLQVVCTKFKRKKILLSSSAFRLLKVIFGGYSGSRAFPSVFRHELLEFLWPGNADAKSRWGSTLARPKSRPFLVSASSIWSWGRRASSIADSGLKSLAQKIESQKITNLLCLSVTLVGDDAVVFGINRYVFFCNINSQSYYQSGMLFVIVRNS